MAKSASPICIGSWRSVTIIAGDDIADYDPAQDADLYEYWKAEDRYWEAG